MSVHMLMRRHYRVVAARIHEEAWMQIKAHSEKDIYV